jgi:uncharacterized membrane protein
MRDDVSRTKNIKRSRVIRHVVAAFVVGFPLCLCGLLAMMNANYVGLLVKPNSQVQPFGWLLTLTILTLSGLAYLDVITISSLWWRYTNVDRSTIRIMLIGLLIIGLIVLVVALIVLILFGPAMLLAFGQDIL